MRNSEYNEFRYSVWDLKMVLVSKMIIGTVCVMRIGTLSKMVTGTIE